MRRGFTVLELSVIVGIIAVLTAIALPALRSFGKQSDLNNSAEEIINKLRLAQNKTLASEEASSWGVYFSTTTQPNQYILFKGTDFISRSSSSDEVLDVPKSVEIYQLNLAGGAKEVAFQRITGNAGQSGNIVLRSKADSSQTKTVYIESSGQAGLSGQGIISDGNRVKDSRHVFTDYSRYIETAAAGENLVLNFEGGIVQTIVIASNMQSGQIYWEGEVGVGGSVQKIKIHTNRLNQPDSQFSIHRDRRYNNKALNITVSGDATGSLIEYSADGLTVSKTSIYASDPQLQ